MPQSASMTDEPADCSTSDSSYVTITPDDILDPMLAPTEGVRGWVDSWRYGAPTGRSPGVHPDVVTGAAHNAWPGDPAGDQLLAVDDPRINSGAAEAEFAAKSARHRAGTWPRDDDVLVDVRDVREGRYGPAS